MDNNDDAYNAAIAEVLLARKKELGMTFADLALISGIKVQSVMRLLNGHRPIHMSNFNRLVAALDVPPAKVMAEAARISHISK